MPLMPEEQKKARRKAMMLLEHMDRTEKGLSDRLRQAGFSVEAVEDALGYVSSFGYIDDERYAENYIAGRIGAKSRQKILSELVQKGVSRETAAAAWERTAQIMEADEALVLRRTLLKRWEPDTELEDKELRRLYGYLLRRGFSSGDISRVLEEVNIRRKNSF